MESLDYIKDYAVTCMKCMKAHITDHKNLFQIKMDVRSCKAATARYPQETFHECVKGKINKYVSLPCKEACRIPPKITASTTFPPIILPRRRDDLNSFF